MSLWPKQGIRQFNITDWFDKAVIPVLSEARFRRLLPLPVMS
jgi:hypothetical protein